MIRRTARTTIAASTLALLALGLTACGGDEPTAADTPQDTVTVTESAGDDTGDADTTGSGDDTGSGNGSGASAGGSGGGDALSAAATTASGAVSGTVVGVDQQAGGWQVDVVATDGSETQVDVSDDGSEVLGQRPDDQDGDDAAENQQLLDAQVDWAAALETARGELGDSIDELDLSEDDGRIVWEASVPGDGPGSTVVIDAASGQVIGTDD